jgi:hypothetical protein
MSSSTVGPNSNYALPRYHDRKPGDPLTMQDVYEILRYGVKHLGLGEVVRAAGCRWMLVEPEGDPLAEDYEEIPVAGALLLLDRRVWKQILATLEKNMEETNVPDPRSE